MGSSRGRASTGALDNGEEEEIKMRWLGTGVAPDLSEGDGRDAELRRGILSYWRHLGRGRKRDEREEVWGFIVVVYLGKGARVWRGEAMDGRRRSPGLLGLLTRG
jgi:hypothetical protein